MYVVHVDRQRSFTGQIQRGPAPRSTRCARAGHRVGVIAHPGSELARRARERGRRGARAADARRRALPVDPARGARAARSRRRRAPLPRRARPGAARSRWRALARVPHLRAHQAQPHRAARLRAASRVYRACDRIVTVSDFVRGAARRAPASSRRASSASRPRSISSASARGRATRRWPRRSASREGDLVVGNVSSLHRRKGIEELLRALRAAAARSARRARARPARRHSSTAQWQPLARELGVAERVRFPGFRDDVRRAAAALRRVRAAVAPARRSAPARSRRWPRAARWSSATSDGLAEAVAPGTGLRVPPRDPERAGRRDRRAARRSRAAPRARRRRARARRRALRRRDARRAHARALRGSARAPGRRPMRGIAAAQRAPRLDGRRGASRKQDAFHDAPGLLLEPPRRPAP